MGLFDSKSTSTTLQTSTTTDARAAAGDNSLVITGGTVIQNDVSAPIAIAAIETGAKLVRDIQGQSLDFGARAVDSARSIADHALSASVDTVRGNSQLAQTLAEVAITNVEKNKRDPTDDTLQTVVATVGKYGAVAVAVIVAGSVVFLIYRHGAK